MKFQITHRIYFYYVVWLEAYKILSYFLFHQRFISTNWWFFLFVVSIILASIIPTTIGFYSIYDSKQDISRLNIFACLEIHKAFTDCFSTIMNNNEYWKREVFVSVNLAIVVTNYWRIKIEYQKRDFESEIFNVLKMR